ncbi:DUF6226 family protein [Agrococcus sp. Marseille-P2731]|uniref:DUF6226 family protein n=1 Tax=Agrococcus sp. Marseille-P2731 TaxID=1841862 RepID=UPI000930A825|nr:DUF6226 family protein [Agrococcus sp. Marseille-P2731]
MPAYVRPEIVIPSVRDADGEFVPFGERWRQPPEKSYSGVTHPERFAPLQRVAEALVEHLVATYEVDLEQGPAIAAALPYPPEDVVRAVRLTPRDRVAAPISIVLTRFPGVMVHAGVLQFDAFPACGCDACDEDVERLVGELEDLVLAVARGWLKETVTPRGVHHRVEFASGSRSGTADAEELGAERLHAAQERLRERPNGWQAWPLRVG